MNFAQMERERRASEIADRNPVGRLVDAVLEGAELFDLTLQLGAAFRGERTGVY